MAANKDSLPNVFEYLDVCSYLQDYYRARKKIAKKFSYELWAEELGFQSRSFLRMMVMGKKKLTGKAADLMAQHHFFTADEREYFHCLVKYSQFGQAKDRKFYGQRMIQIMKRQGRGEVILDRENLTADPLLPRMLSFFSYTDVVKTPLFFAKLLNITEEKSLESLQLLKSLGLANYNEELAVWESQISTFKVPDSKGSLHLRLFHEKSLAEAILAFDKPVATRRYKSLLLPMSVEALEAFNQALDDFAKEQLIQHNHSTYGGKRLYQVNFNIYPVAEYAEEMTEV